MEDQSLLEPLGEPVPGDATATGSPAEQSANGAAPSPVQEARSMPAAARIAIESMAPGPVEGYYVVRACELAHSKNGKPYLKLKLGDATGVVDARVWDDAAERYPTAGTGAVVRVKGTFETSERWGDTLSVKQLEPLAEGEYERAELEPASPVPLERLESDLRELAATIQRSPLRELIERILGPGGSHWQAFRDAPAAKYFHQAYLHGLLEHTLSVAQSVSAAASTFPGIDRDVAVTGALLHDIGKLEAYNSDIAAIDMTDAGKLQGEIPLGYYLVRSEIERIEGFPPELAQAVLHIVLSHHGTLEHGSPVVPATREATLVHAMDNLGGKLGSFDRIERALPSGEQWSEFDRGIDGRAYFAARGEAVA